MYQIFMMQVVWIRDLKDFITQMLERLCLVSLIAAAQVLRFSLIYGAPISAPQKLIVTAIL
jgi:hypothetical protein